MPGVPVGGECRRPGRECGCIRLPFRLRGPLSARLLLEMLLLLPCCLRLWLGRVLRVLLLP